jgi:hypothetical protein
MKTRVVIVTSTITTVIVLLIVVIAFSVASPTLAQGLPAEAPSLADAHLAMPMGGGGGGGAVWNILGGDMTDAYSTEDHSFAFGCIYYNTAYPLTKAVATVRLPNGSIMNWMRFYWRDWFAENSELQLRRYYYSSGIFTYDVLATIFSSGSVADPTESYTSTALDVTVDNYNSFYGVWIDLHYNEDDMKVCGIQIGYTPPSIFGAAMPVIEK